MAWTAPRTWVAGELVTEDHLNEQLRDNLNVLKVAVDANGKIGFAVDLDHDSDLVHMNI